jgi:hypothetical protein
MIPKTGILHPVYTDNHLMSCPPHILASDNIMSSGHIIPRYSVKRTIWPGRLGQILDNSARFRCMGNDPFWGKLCVSCVQRSVATTPSLCVRSCLLGLTVIPTTLAFYSQIEPGSLFSLKVVMIYE